VSQTLLALRVAARASSTRVVTRVSTLAVALLVGACSTTGTPGSYGGPIEPPAVPGAPDTAGTPGAPGQGSTPAPSASPLATEQRHFENWFRGTPVVIVAQPQAAQPTLLVDVPLANSFDAGKADIKPALAAVLERVAESLQRQLGARVTVAAPADPGGNAALAQQRAQRVREHLVSRRIAAPRIALGGAARAGAALQLRMTIPPAAFPAVSRLQSPNIVPMKGVKPAAATPEGETTRR
jgi:outer membrane protein OmpA-like peptidoglycan-associated protein